MLKRTIIVSLGVMLALVLGACTGGDESPQADRNTTGGNYSASVDTTISLTEAQLSGMAESVDDDLLTNGRVSLGQSELVVAGDYRCRSGEMEPGSIRMTMRVTMNGSVAIEPYWIDEGCLTLDNIGLMTIARELSSALTDLVAETALPDATSERSVTFRRLFIGEDVLNVQAQVRAR